MRCRGCLRCRTKRMDSSKEHLPRLTTLYLACLEKQDTRSFVTQVMKFYNESSLIRLTGAVCTDTRRAAAQSLGFVGTYQANDTLGHLLQDRDRTVRLIAEGSLKAVWSRDGSEAQRRELYAIMRLIAAQNFDEAINRANMLLDDYPFYVEARNQRAIALFALEQFEDSIEDSRNVLELNPFHFGAAIGMGHAYLQLENHQSAIECFQRALDINPNLEFVRRHLARLSGSWMR